MSEAIIAVFRGGTSAEREVSLGSGAAALASLRRQFAHVEDVTIDDDAVPPSVRADTHVVFSTLHGVFGEDGGMQALLEAAGIQFAGCDAASSRICFDKRASKERAAEAGVPVAPGTWVPREESGRAGELLGTYGPRVVFKPNCQGSSVGVCMLDNADELAAAIAGCDDHGCVVESLIQGREVTIGVLDGAPLGVVEIIPRAGWFDYTNKYTKGKTEYVFPARLNGELIEALRRHAAAVFAACGCRDFARADFMVDESGQPRFLEINTLPGLKETSLLPMSAQCDGLDFDALVHRMMSPALQRFADRREPAPVRSPR